MVLHFIDTQLLWRQEVWFLAVWQAFVTAWVLGYPAFVAFFWQWVSSCSGFAT